MVYSGRGLHKTPTTHINGTKSGYLDGLFNPQLILTEEFWVGFIQAAAQPERESVRINALKGCPLIAEALNDSCACSVFSYIPDFLGQGISSKLHLIHRRNISFKPLDWSRTNFSSRFPHKFRNSPASILTKMLNWKEKDSIKYGDIPDPSQTPLCFARSSQCCKSSTRRTKTNSVIIGPVWPRTKAWSTTIRIFLNQQRFLSGHGYRPSGEFDIRIRNFLNPLSRVETFEYAMNPESYLWTLIPDIFFIRWT